MAIIQKQTIIMIKSGKTAGLSPLTMDIPDNTENRLNMASLIVQETPVLNIKEVNCETKGKLYVVNLTCEVENAEDLGIVLTYNVSHTDFMGINIFFKKQSILAKVTDGQAGVALVKKIVDSYDPFIRVTRK